MVFHSYVSLPEGIPKNEQCSKALWVVACMRLRILATINRGLSWPIIFHELRILLYNIRLNAQWRKLSPQPLSHSATLPEWLDQPLSHSATLPSHSGHSGRVAEWLSGWSSHSRRVAEWLSGWVAEWLVQPLWQSGWVAEWLVQPLWESGWVAEWPGWITNFLHW